MKIKQNMMNCIDVALIILIMFAGNAAATPLNYPPVADANGPYESCVGSIITLDASGSYDPDYPIGSIVSWEWDIDDDGEFDDASGETVDWTWGSVGDKVVSLRVTDDVGAIDVGYATVRVNECGEIPEFPTIALPVIAILGLAFFFQRRKD
ncbi:PKD domain-containing protein [Methanolobus sp. ZRKC5]|uniref:PKD domain-containing protein n=1 Tax=unclassified Methanolobus TaxID=2629569 RepID=UPI00313A92A7